MWIYTYILFNPSITFVMASTFTNKITPLLKKYTYKMYFNLNVYCLYFTSLQHTTYFNKLRKVLQCLDYFHNNSPLCAGLTIPPLTRTMLFINHEGCVNTLQDECQEFYRSHGRWSKVSSKIDV